MPQFSSFRRSAILTWGVVVLSLFGYDSMSQDQYHAKIYGHVKSEWTGEPLLGVTVYIESLKQGAVTDLDGYFEMTILKGIFNVTFRRVDLKPIDLKLDILKDTELDVELKENTLNLDEITIYSQKADENVKSLDVGKNVLDIERINAMPSFLGEVDVVKSLTLLPGVSTVGEGASGFNVRGGGVDQNLIMQDGGLIFNSSHVFGFFSVFNPIMVDNATLYKSGIPARYGGRVSSVLDVRLKDGNFQIHEVSGGIGLVSGKLALSGPIIKNKLSYSIGGRASYSDWLLRRADDADLKKSSASFQDLNIKLSYLLSDKDKLTYSTYFSNDGFSFASDTIFDWQTQNHVLSWNHGFNEKMHMDTEIAKGEYGFNIENTNAFDPFIIHSQIDYESLNSIWFYEWDDQHKLNAGFQVYQYHFSPGEQKPTSETSAIDYSKVEDERSIEWAAFVENELPITNSISIKAGLRYSHFNNLGEGTDYLYNEGASRQSGNIKDTITYKKNESIASYGGWEPRVTINFKLSESSSVKASYNRTRQYLHLISNTAAVTPTDFWKTSNRYIPPEIADQYSIGYFRNFMNNTIEGSIEGYYKQAEDIVDFKDGSILLMNKNIEADLINGNSEAYGVEFFLNKKSGRTTGWFSYTYSRTFRKVNGTFEDEKINLGKKYPANYDKPHDFTIALNQKFSPVTSFGMNFTYSTGRPSTVPLSLYNVSTVTQISNFSLRNQERIPDYHRLDVSMTLKSKPRTDRRWNTSWNFSIYNLYGRSNAYSVFFRNDFGVPPRAYKLSVLGNAFPSAMFNFEF